MMDTSIHSLTLDKIMALIQESKTLAKTNIGDRIKGKEVCESAVVEFEVFRARAGEPPLERQSASSVSSTDEALRLISNFELPILEILQSVCSRKGTTLPSMICLVDDIGKVVMRSSKSLVKLSLCAFRAVAIYILNGLHRTIGERVGAGADYRMGLVHLIESL
ncbi:hypothetical protein HG531_005462 [Fusarium graminearum]|nr:hypothetical protein HG531_005462 [Fusarium graminearum]